MLLVLRLPLVILLTTIVIVLQDIRRSVSGAAPRSSVGQLLTSARCIPKPRCRKGEKERGKNGPLSLAGPTVSSCVDTFGCRPFRETLLSRGFHPHAATRDHHNRDPSTSRISLSAENLTFFSSSFSCSALPVLDDRLLSRRFSFDLVVFDSRFFVRNATARFALLGLLKTRRPKKRLLLDSILATDPFRPPPSLSLLVRFLALASLARSLAAKRSRPRDSRSLHPRPAR